MRFAAISVSLLLGAAALPTAVGAQAPTRPGAFRASLGLGLGSFRVSCPTICAGERNGGTAGHATIGVSVGKGLILGGELSAWRDRYTTGDQDTPVRERVYLLGPSLEWYPAPARPVHFGITMGYLSYNLDFPQDEDSDPITGGTFGIQVRGGYDFQLVKGLKVSPYVAFMGGLKGELSSEEIGRAHV